MSNPYTYPPPKKLSTWNKATKWFDEPFVKSIPKEKTVGITAAALAAWLLYQAHSFYKKKMAETKDPVLAANARINYLKSSMSKCQKTNDPLKCKVRIQTEIRKLQINQK